ncbi:MAG: hypothetical protein V7605_645 [Acidimicrobiaceae bacterium]
MTDFLQTGLDAGREALRRFLTGQDDLASMQTKITLLATEAVPTCDIASITMLRAGEPVTAASSDRTAKFLDETQYELGEGPCLSAIRHRGAEHVRTRSDDRWPAFSATASDRGVLSVLSVPLGNAETVMGALNLYSETNSEFDSTAREVASGFADQLGVAAASMTLYVEGFELSHQLQQAMESRAAIEQAKGILMAAEQCGPDTAFAILVRASQSQNRKLRDIATEIVEGYERGQDVVSRHAPSGSDATLSPGASPAMAVRGQGARELAEFLRASHLAVPDDVPALIVEYARGLGAGDAALYLVDYEQRLLVPLPSRGGPVRDEVVINSTLAGRCYRTLDIQQTTSEDGRGRVWAPVLDGAERLGVLELAFDPADEPALDDVADFAGMVAEVVMSKQVYGDFFERVRRRRPMSVAAELAWRLLPPLTFGTDRLVISAVLSPVYELGGDSFDYSVDADTARISIFDAMGHGLEAGLMASVAMAACRNSRRTADDLVGSTAAIDRAISAQFGPDRFVTGVLADLDLASGRLQWSVSGHPPPLLLRNGRIVKTLKADVGLPFGIGGTAVVAEEMLERADQVLFFTDGVVEARSPDGEFFGVDRLVDMVSRASASATPAPETMRRLIHAILDHQEGELQDDATIVVVEWRGPGARLLEV